MVRLLKIFLPLTRVFEYKIQTNQPHIFFFLTASNVFIPTTNFQAGGEEVCIVPHGATHVFPNFTWTRWATVPLVRLGLSQLAPRQRRDSRILCFLIPHVSSPLRQTLTVPSAPQRCPERGSISCDALAPDTLSHQHTALEVFPPDSS